MKRLDVEQFRHELLQASAQSLVEAQRACGEGQLYGFSLVLDALGSAVSAIAQSEEGLERSVAKEAEGGYWATKTGNLRGLLAKMKRWTCEDWLSCETFFGEANRLLHESYASNPEDFLERGSNRLVYLCCLTTLADLDVQGAFGNGKHREAIVLNLYLGDQSDEELLRWAIQVNPYEVYTRYATELQEAHAAFKELVYTGPA